MVTGGRQTEVPSSVPSEFPVSLTNVKFWSTSGETLTILSMKRTSVAREGPKFCITTSYTKRFPGKLKGSYERGS